MKPKTSPAASSSSPVGPSSSRHIGWAIRSIAPCPVKIPRAFREGPGPLARRRRTGRARKGRTLARPDASLRPRLTGTWPLKPSQSCAIASIREPGWELSEIGYGMWGWAAGPARTTSRRCSARRGRRARLQLLRYGLGVRRRTQRAAARPDAPRTAARALRRDESPAQEPPLAGLDDFPLDEVFPPDHIREIPRRASRTSASRRSTCSSSTPGATRGRGRPLAARHRRPEARGLIRGLGISVNRWEPTNVLQRSTRGWSTACRSSTTSSTRIPEDVLFPLCQELASPSSRACRSTKAA